MFKSIFIFRTLTPNLHSGTYLIGVMQNEKASLIFFNQTLVNMYFHKKEAINNLFLIDTRIMSLNENTLRTKGGAWEDICSNI